MIQAELEPSPICLKKKRSKCHPRYKAIFFDLDDTILNFTQSEKLSLAHIYHLYYCKNIAEDHFMLRFHSINQMLWRTLEKGNITAKDLTTSRFDLLHKELQIDICPIEVSEIYLSLLVSNTTLFDGTEEALHSLKEYFQLAVITNGLSKVQRKKYQLFNIDKWASAYIVSEEVEFSKPHKDIFKIALDKLEILPHEALMVGDSLSSDYIGSLNAGLDFCWVKPSSIDLPSHLAPPLYTVNDIADLSSILYKELIDSK